MKLGELLAEELIETKFQARDKWESISALVDRLATGGRLPAARKKSVLDALTARERVASTGMEHGVALPHASVDGLPGALAALGLSPGGIPFASADGKPARIVLLLAIPRAAVRTHVHTLAGIARLLNDEEMRRALLAATTPGEALAIIRDKEKEDA